MIIDDNISGSGTGIYAYSDNDYNDRSIIIGDNTANGVNKFDDQ